MIFAFLQVGIGGAIGSCLRYGAGLAVLRLVGPGGFPLGVIAVNILGSFLMGIFAVLTIERELAHLNPLVMAGLLGGFTTFSAFSLDALRLMEAGRASAALAYVAGSVILSIMACASGLWIARSLS